jgi:ABC-type multidrug transport system ATPase subunit
MRLVVENLSKEYRGKAGAVRAVNGVQLSPGPGVLGLLGPNGAGKSTLMRILRRLRSRLLAAFCGTIRTSRGIPILFGLRSGTCRRISAYVPI